jgi:hypothetical protein
MQEEAKTISRRISCYRDCCDYGGLASASCKCFNHYLVVYSDLGKSYDSEHL